MKGSDTEPFKVHYIAYREPYGTKTKERKKKQNKKRLHCGTFLSQGQAQGEASETTDDIVL